MPWHHFATVQFNGGTHYTYTDELALTGYPMEYKVKGFWGSLPVAEAYASCTPVDNTSPPKVTGLTGTWDPYTRTAKLTWDAIPMDQEPNLGGYWVCPEVILPEGGSTKGHLNNHSLITRTWYEEIRTDPVGSRIRYRVCAMDRSGQLGEWSDPVDVVITSGCPFLYVWDGKQFVEDNNILPTSPQHPGKDVSDYYLMQKAPVEDKNSNAYLLRIAKYETEHSYIDQVRLIAVDHTSNVEIIVDQNGNIQAYSVAKLTPPATCTDEKGKDQLSNVTYEDTKCYVGADSTWLKATFDPDPARIIKITGYVKADSPPYIPEVDEPVPLRWNPSDIGIIVPPDTDKITIHFYAPHRIDCINISTYGYDFIIKECTLKEAIDSKGNSVKNQLIWADGNYVELVPKSTITLYFSVPDRSPDLDRAFVFITTGRYITEAGGGGQAAFGTIPQYLLSITPTPAIDVVKLQFAIPVSEHISLKLFDVSGREVRTIADDEFNPGYYTITVETDQLPAGIYFVTLRTNTHTFTAKAVIVK